MYNRNTVRHFSALFLLFGLSILVLGLTACKQEQHSGDTLLDIQKRGYLKIGVKFDSPPFGFLNEKQQLQGLEIDVAHTIAKDILGNPDAIKFIQVQTVTRIPTLQARQVDMVIATMTITDERKKVVDFTEPYFFAHQKIMVRKTSPYQKLSDLVEKPVIFVIGGTGEARLKKAEPKLILNGVKSSTEGFTAFYAGRAEAFSQDDTILNGFLSKHCGVRLLPHEMSVEPYGIAFRKESASKALEKKIERILKKLTEKKMLETEKQLWIKTTPPATCP